MSLTLTDITGGNGGGGAVEECERKREAEEVAVVETAPAQAFDIYSAMMQPILPPEGVASSPRPRDRQPGEGVDIVELRAQERQLEHELERGLRKAAKDVKKTAEEREVAKETLDETRESRVASGATNNVRWRHEAGLSARQDLINDRRSITRRNLRLDAERRADRAAADRRAADRSWQDRRR